MAEPLYPKGTIVRYTVGPLGVIDDAAASMPRSRGVVKWRGETGIYVGPAGRVITQSTGEQWHIVLDEFGDVPVLAGFIEPDPAHAEKNEALKSEVPVG